MEKKDIKQIDILVAEIANILDKYLGKLRKLPQPTNDKRNKIGIVLTRDFSTDTFTLSSEKCKDLKSLYWKYEADGNSDTQTWVMNKRKFEELKNLLVWGPELKSKKGE